MPFEPSLYKILPDGQITYHENLNVGKPVLLTDLKSLDKGSLQAIVFRHYDGKKGVIFPKANVGLKLITEIPEYIHQVKSGKATPIEQAVVRLYVMEMRYLGQQPNDSFDLKIYTDQIEKGIMEQYDKKLKEPSLPTRFRSVKSSPATTPLLLSASIVETPSPTQTPD